MWIEIYKWAFVIIHILAIIMYLVNLSRGTYQETKTPLGNGVGMLCAVLWLIGFFKFFW